MITASLSLCEYEESVSIKPILCRTIPLSKGLAPLVLLAQLVVFYGDKVICSRPTH